MENRGESTKPRDKDLHGGPSVSQSHTEMANLSDWKCLNQEKTPHSQQPSHPRLYCSSVKKIATLRSFHKAGFWHMITELALWVLYDNICRCVWICHLFAYYILWMHPWFAHGESSILSHFQQKQFNEDTWQIPNSSNCNSKKEIQKINRLLCFSWFPSSNACR